MIFENSTFLLTEIPRRRLVHVTYCLLSACKWFTVLSVCMVCSAFNCVESANARKDIYGACLKTHHLFITELRFRNCSALNGSRLILGGSVLRATVFVIKKLFFPFRLWRFFLSFPQCPQFLICSAANIRPSMTKEGKPIFKFLLNVSAVLGSARIWLVIIFRIPTGA